jgi:hypothetical protein
VVWGWLFEVTPRGVLRSYLEFRKSFRQHCFIARALFIIVVSRLEDSFPLAMALSIFVCLLGVEGERECRGDLALRFPSQ